MEGKKGLLKIGTVAERLGVAVSHAYRLAREGELPCVRIGKKSIRFEETAVDTYIRRHRRKAPPAA